MKLHFVIGNQHISLDRTPDLRLDGVLAFTWEFIDSQVLLDPLEEQFDLPAVSVQCGNGQRWQDKVIGLEDQRLSTVGILKTDVPHILEIILSVISLCNIAWL